MKTTNQVISSMILAVIVLFAPVVLMAQPPFDPGGSPDVPIDGGLSILLAAGAGYVVKKGYDRKKRKEKERNEKNDI
jgi:hypothetical protein